MNIRVMLRPFLGGLIAALASACGFYKWDMENTCHAVERSKVRELPITKEEDVLTLAASWAAERARSTEGKRLWNALPNINPGSRAEIIRDAAKEAGVVDCPLADALEAAILADELERQQRLQKKLQKPSPVDASPAPERESTKADAPL
ncbi:hypothetical protein [Myxococcus sp. AB056]|uniref:hypothetical protein n=2 Tax=unclassified Myxococcus TaxID=2648731 RepID=UPI0011465D17|nr:hypothetical protein [Myxococcus sp. AB056]